MDGGIGGWEGDNDPFHGYGRVVELPDDFGDNTSHTNTEGNPTTNVPQHQTNYRPLILEDEPEEMEEIEHDPPPPIPHPPPQIPISPTEKGEIPIGNTPYANELREKYEQEDRLERERQEREMLEHLRTKGGKGAPAFFNKDGSKRYVIFGDTPWAKRMRKMNEENDRRAREKNEREGAGVDRGRSEGDGIGSGVKNSGAREGSGSRIGNTVRHHGQGGSNRRIGDGKYQIFGDRIRVWRELAHARGAGNETPSQGQQNQQTSQSDKSNPQSPISPKNPDPRTLTATSSFIRRARQRIEFFISGYGPDPLFLEPQDIETNLACIGLAITHLRWQIIQLSTASPPQPDKEQELNNHIDRLRKQIEEYLIHGKKHPHFSSPLVVSQRDEDCENRYADLQRRFQDAQAQNYRLQGPDTFLEQQDMENLMTGVYQRMLEVCSNFLLFPDWNRHAEQIQNNQSVAYAVQYGLHRFPFMAARRLWRIVVGYLGRRFLPGLDLHLGDGVGAEEFLVDLDRLIIGKVNPANPPSHFRWKSDTARHLAVHILQLDPMTDFRYASTNPNQASGLLSQRPRLRETIDDAVITEISPRFAKMLLGVTTPVNEDLLVAFLREIMTYAILLYISLQTSRTELRFVMPERGMAFDPEAMEAVNSYEDHVRSSAGHLEVLVGITSALMGYESNGDFSCVVKAKVILRAFADSGGGVEDGPEDELEEVNAGQGDDGQNWNQNQGQRSGFQDNTGFQGRSSNRGGNQSNSGFQGGNSNRGSHQGGESDRGNNRGGYLGKNFRADYNPGDKNKNSGESSNSSRKQVSRGNREDNRANSNRGNSKDMRGGRTKGDGNKNRDDRNSDSNKNDAGRGGANKRDKGQSERSGNNRGNRDGFNSDRERGGGRGRGRGNDRGGCGDSGNRNGGDNNNGSRGRGGGGEGRGRGRGSGNSSGGGGGGGGGGHDATGGID